jgi:glycine/D-amino acid oxidase-like deaminating enzyme
MVRRPDPLRIYAARRAGLFQRLVREARVSEDSAERWISAWEIEAALRGLDRRKGGWWEPAWGWIAEQRPG